MRSTITGVVWGGDGGLYALDFPESADSLIWRIHDHSAEKVQIPPIRDACDAPSPRAIFPLPNGWGAAMGCGGSIHVVAVTQAGAERLATVTNIGGIATVAWNSSAAVGVIGQGSYWCSSMLPVAQGKLPAWPSVLGGKLVDEGLNTSLIKDKTCEQSGNMGWPAFTADGSLYFAGSAATRGVRSVDRADQDHTIFRADMERGLLEKVATGFSNVTALSASDDGSVIAVAGRRQNKKGLHILRPHTGQVCYRSYSELTQATLTPDGRRVAVVQRMGDSGNRTLSISIENLGSESRTSI